MIIIEPLKKFCRGDLKFEVDSGNVGGIGSCIICIIFDLSVLIQNINHFNVKK